MARGAREKLTGERKERFYRDFILPLTGEAARLGITAEELGRMLEKGMMENGD